MPQSIGVLALDAADFRLFNEFECDNLKLDKCQRLETDAWSGDRPGTKEVWPSVATGVTPEVHGWTYEKYDPGDGKPVGKVSYKAPLPIRIGRHFSEIIPKTAKQAVRGYYSDHGLEHIQVDHDHCFDEVYMWPGITPATNLSISHVIMGGAQQGELTHEEVQQRTLDITLEEFKWLATKTSGLIGAHSHILDVAGHIYCQRRDRLKDYYRRVDALVGWLRIESDELVILSDHGMRVGWLDDGEIGEHSFEAVVSSTNGLNGLPDSIYDVREWLEGQTSEDDDKSEISGSDTTEQQLKDLGYI